jgi:uncharacterized protein DUF6675
MMPIGTLYRAAAEFIRLALIAGTLGFALPCTASANEGPAPPCAGTPRPPYAKLGEAPHLQVFRPADLHSDWPPPECAGLMSHRPRLLVALAGQFRSEDTLDMLLQRFGAISALPNVRYWSISDRRWELLISRATALNGPRLESPRSDFTVEDLKSGGDLYFAQKDNRSAELIIYRMQVRDLTSRGFFVEMENLTPVIYLMMEVYPAGSMRSSLFLDQREAGSWYYYSLTEVGANASPLLPIHEKSYINRAVALFRHIARIPTDQEPPAAP